MEEALAELPGQSRHIRSAIKSGDYLSACEWIKNKLDERWTGFLREKFLTPAYKPNSVHELILSLDAYVYITPNFDKIFDNFVTERTQGTTIVKSYYEDDAQHLVRSGTRVILKIHGSIDTPHRMIFGRSKYAEARVQNATFYQLVDALLLTNTFLIFGCGLDDPDFQLLFENFCFRFPTADPHYMTMADSINPDLESLTRETRKIKFLKYSKANNHRELELSISNLVELVERERRLMAESQTW
ncbi:MULTISPECIES: SIR2 family protein [unclassified Bradyrhizobium]|uniref:SIR2 family NAD-dependent protein deacylase n=1 Tax=unclassified Bradyrhizobium TaxID=2631580 RepID=UPI0028E2BA63|nr:MULTISPECIES: SIR2 family protein [unclassified Bradyrhizobium]